MLPDTNRFVVVISGGVVTGVYADDYRHCEVVVLDFDNDGVSEEDTKSDEAFVRLADGSFARGYDEEASDIRKIGTDSDVKKAYEHVLQTKRCPTCEGKLKFFMHNCGRTTHCELHGCPVCDDECGYCS